MKFLLNFRQNLGYKRLCSKVSSMKREKTFNNLGSAQRVGILFDSTQQANYQAAKAFVSELHDQGKEVLALGMALNEEMLRYYVPQNDIRYFSLEKLSLFCYPNSQDVENFIETKFDILLNISPIENLCVDYIMGLSKALFKVSPQLSNNDFADFLLQFKDQSDLNSQILIAKIKEYLSLVKKA